MHPQPSEGGGGPRADGVGAGNAPTGLLEDRLRSMILANSEKGSEAHYGPAPRSAGAPAAATPPSSFAYPSSALGPGPASGPASGLGPGPGPRAGQRGRSGPDWPPVASTAGPDQPPVSPRSGRKRPNQAQRRQMSAQLSIPIDPRPTALHSAGTYASPPGYGNQHHSFQHAHPAQHGPPFQGQNGYSHHPQHSQHPQHPHSATFRPPHYGQGHGPPSSYPSQPRHHQSLSYQGPPAHDPFNWRSQPGPPLRPPYPPHAPPSHQPAFAPYEAPSPRNARPHNGHPPSGRPYHVRPDDIQTQAALLEQLCEQVVGKAEIEPAEIQEKEQFRVRIERLCQEVLAQYERETNNRPDFPALSVQLKCFGSLSSGFATKASDMDLGLISPLSDPQPDFPKSPIPRLVEKAFLDAGLGARLLTRTRVPIIKLCEKPPEALLLDLQDERAKWERGLLPEHDGAEADEDVGAEDAKAGAPAGADGAVGETTPDGGGGDVGEDGSSGSGGGGRGSGSGGGRRGGVDPDNKAGHGRNESVLDDEPLSGDRYSYALAHLKQQAGQSLGNYYAAAKRVLRKVGGRDVSLSTVREFQEHDLKILTDVCHAFVEGLADAQLQSRLRATRSLATVHTPSPLNYRSLFGVFMQAEGEALAMLWDQRTIHERDARLEREAQDRFWAFAELQNKPTFAQDLMWYNKELHTAVEGLRKITSLQVMTLEQGAFESPTQYHERAARLLFQSGGRDTGAASADDDPVLREVVRHYIAGIGNGEIREQVESFAQTMERPSLRAVARRHKSLQLALEFEKALGKDCYKDAEAVAAAQAYIGLLRQPLQKRALPGRRFDYVVARTAATAATIAQARRLLGDPSQLAPNQPRDPYRDRLEFPKSGVGVQCDINFSAHLALQNTLLLRCYSHTDARVRPLVLFVKNWAKTREINSPYRGTLSSYGYVLMVLHYLVNVAQPFVCPNLQQLARGAAEAAAADDEAAAAAAAVAAEAAQLSPAEREETVSCRGRDVRFWRDEAEIQALARQGLLTQNKDSLGHLLRGFFEYYAQGSMMSTVPRRGFDWGREVLSLRTPGGLRSKVEKGWTGARTVLMVQNQASSPGPGPGPGPAAAAAPAVAPAPAPADEPSRPPAGQAAAAAAAAAAPVEVKEVKHRYLFAIEDPFELDHNVARTVTHNGIVAIRDEFRRAWRIIKNLGRAADEDLLQDVEADKASERDVFGELLDEIHGPEV